MRRDAVRFSLASLEEIGLPGKRKSLKKEQHLTFSTSQPAPELYNIKVIIWLLSSALCLCASQSHFCGWLLLQNELTRIEIINYSPSARHIYHGAILCPCITFLPSAFVCGWWSCIIQQVYNGNYKIHARLSTGLLCCMYINQAVSTEMTRIYLCNIYIRVRE